MTWVWKVSVALEDSKAAQESETPGCDSPWHPLRKSLESFSTSCAELSIECSLWSSAGKPGSCFINSQ